MEKCTYTFLQRFTFYISLQIPKLRVMVIIVKKKVYSVIGYFKTGLEIPEPCYT